MSGKQKAEKQKTLVCASFKVQNLAQALQDIEQASTDGAKAVEFRLEEFTGSEVELKQLISFAKARQLLTISTCRNEKQAKVVENALASGINLVDIDLLDLKRGKLSVEKNRLILSHHDFDKTPSTTELVEIITECFSHADVAKVACKSSGEEDNARLLSLYKIFLNKKLIAIGMGECGSETRLAAFERGAFLTYACLSKETSTALGQFTVKELVKLAIGRYPK